MSTLDASIVQDLADRVAWAVRAIDGALLFNRDIDDDNKHVDRPPTPDSLEPTVIVADFLLRVRALPPSMPVDEYFARLYRSLARLPRTAEFNEEALRSFAEEYSILTRIAALNTAHQEVTAASRAMELAQQVLDATITKHDVAETEHREDEMVALKKDVVNAKKEVAKALVHLMNVSVDGATKLNDLVVVGQYGVYWGNSTEP